jgi:uncharacterized membrane protein
MPATGWAVMTVLCRVLIAVVVWTIVALVSRDDGANRSTTAVGPEEILDGHLARIKIDAATYDALREKLRAAAWASKQ